MLSVKLNHTFKLMLCSCIVSFYQFIIGASYIFSSILFTKLKDPTTPIKINSEDESWIASVPLLVCPVGLLLIGLLTDKIGRIKALQIAYIPLIISWLILAYANTLNAIIIGRTIMGTTLGSVTYVYLYMGEICPTKYRPLCFSIPAIFVGVGMMCECILAMFFHWQTVAFMLFALSSTCFLALFSLPEPPMWLRANGRISDAEKAEKWFGMDPPATTTAITGTANGSNGPGQLDSGPVAGTKPSYWSQFLEPTVWKPALITMSFFVFQQGCGFYVLMLYSMDVLRDFQVQLDGVTVTLFMSISRVVGSLLFSSLHEVHRKKMVVISGSGMAVSLVVVIVYMKTYKDVVDPPYAMFPVIAFVTYMFCALLGMLPLPWAICGELFPISVKGVMGGIVQIFGYEIMFLINKIYPSLVATYGIENIWAVFAGFCLASAFYGAFIMPETKGKSLDEILNSFDSRKKSIKNNLP